MSKIRFKALEKAMDRIPIVVKEPTTKRSELFGINVFNDDAMRQNMTKEAFKGVKNATNHNRKISREVANQVANAMRNWAIERGATHYTHWFQPLTGATAEKHDAFFNISKVFGELLDFPDSFFSTFVDECHGEIGSLVITCWEIVNFFDNIPSC